jgi:CRISPR-associated Csx2 family protein
MERKIFISILGTGYYNPTKYFFDEISGSETETRFVQEAAIKQFCSNWNDYDKIFVFLTKSARITNWVNPAQEKNEKESYTGLIEVLKKLELKAELIDKDIPDGKDENEIWKIFQIIFQQLKENDKVYFDITHAFRSLPMLLMVLINYSKFLKNIEVQSITYGNHQAEKNGYSPIINLTAFSQLQDWTSAADEFINFGNTKKISTLTENPLLSEKLNLFSHNLATCRGIDIFCGDTVEELNIELEKIDKDKSPKPFIPIFQNIKKKTNSYKKDDIINNGLLSIEYCISHNLIQQGITILYEFIITYVLIYFKYNWEDKNYRNTVSGCLNINKIENFSTEPLKIKLIKEVKKSKITTDEMNTILEKQKELAKKIFKLPFIKKLSSDIFKKLSQGSRNDINHAGIRSDPKTSEYLIDRLKKYYNKTKTLIHNNPCS